MIYMLGTMLIDDISSFKKARSTSSTMATSSPGIANTSWSVSQAAVSSQASAQAKDWSVSSPGLELYSCKRETQPRSRCGWVVVGTKISSKLALPYIRLGQIEPWNREFPISIAQEMILCHMNAVLSFLYLTSVFYLRNFIPRDSNIHLKSRSEAPTYSTPCSTETADTP